MPPAPFLVNTLLLASLVSSGVLLVLAVPSFDFDVSQAVLGVSESHTLEHELDHTASLVPGLPEHPEPVSLPVDNPTNSFWVHSPGANPLANVGSTGTLTEEADVCIIGAGLTGVSAAYHLAVGGRLETGRAWYEQLGRTGRVVVFEARDFCSGATGRNGGHLTPTSFLDFRRRQSLYGTADAIKSYDLEDYTTRELVKIIHDVKASEEVDLVEGGHITLLSTPEQEWNARQDYETAKAAGLSRLEDVVWINREEMNKTKGTPYPGFYSTGNNLWPLKLVTRLFRLSESALQRVNVTLHTHTPVTSVSPIQPSADNTTSSGDPSLQGYYRYSLGTPRGDVRCRYVLHATNGYTNYLLDPEETMIRVVPTRGQVIAVQANNGTKEELGKTGWGANGGFEYWFPRPASRSAKEVSEKPLVILGGGRDVAGPKYEYYESDDGEVNERVGETLRGFLPRLFPKFFEAGDVAPTWEWTGIMGYTASGNPYVGPLAKSDSGGASSHQYIAAGYTGHGMPRTFACAEAVVGMVVADIMDSVWTPPPWFPGHYQFNRGVR